MRSVFAASVAAASAADYPVPEIQTAAQKAAFADRAAAAKVASEAATPEVLKFFDSQEFRSAISDCCPEAAAMTSTDLLDRFREEAQVSELAHAFPDTPGESHFTDFTLDVALDYEWFLNECQAKILAGVGCRPDQAETGPFRCPAAAGQSATWDEASSQLIYVAHNMRQSDFGSAPNFGDVTAVFNRAHVKDMVLIAPMDTGLYERGCNRSSTEAPRPGGANCSAWAPGQGVVGTLEHHDHLILSNLYYFASSKSQQKTSVFDNAKKLFERSAFAGDYTQMKNLDSAEVMRYWESDILGNPRLVGGVKLVIGNFANLFGTDQGSKLQMVADHYSWPLFWARGVAPGHHQQTSGSGSQRVLDPTSVHTNATLPTGAKSKFDDLWSQVKSARASQISDSQLTQFWSTLQAQQLRVAPMTARACADVDLCVATDTSSGDCICQSEQALIV